MDVYRTLIGRQMDLELYLMGAHIVGRTDLYTELRAKVADAKQSVSNYLWTHPEVAAEVTSERRPRGGR